MHKRVFFFCALLSVAVLVAACGGGGSNETVPPPPPGGGATGGNTFDMSKANATVTGKISFDGTPPSNDKIQMSSDPYCQMHAADYATAETVRVSEGGLENVIVYISSGLPTGISYPAAANAVDIVQQNCHYIPHVFTIRTNQTLNVQNGDMTLHNIHIWAE